MTPDCLPQLRIGWILQASPTGSTYGSPCGGAAHRASTGKVLGRCLICNDHGAGSREDFPLWISCDIIRTIQNEEKWGSLNDAGARGVLVRGKRKAPWATTQGLQKFIASLYSIVKEFIDM
jgi:hypothetical protein